MNPLHLPREACTHIWRQPSIIPWFLIPPFGGPWLYGGLFTGARYRKRQVGCMELAWDMCGTCVGQWECCFILCTHMHLSPSCWSSPCHSHCHVWVAIPNMSLCKKGEFGLGWSAGCWLLGGHCLLDKQLMQIWSKRLLLITTYNFIEIWSCSSPSPLQRSVQPNILYRNKPSHLEAQAGYRWDCENQAADLFFFGVGVCAPSHS